MATEPTPESLRAIVTLDRTLHEPGRLAIMSQLSVVKTADFLYLLSKTGLTRGNLSSHMRRLEEAGFVEVEKTFADRLPVTAYHLTETGRAAFRSYRDTLLGLLSDLPR